MIILKKNLFIKIAIKNLFPIFNKNQPFFCPIHFAITLKKLSKLIYSTKIFFTYSKQIEKIVYKLNNKTTDFNAQDIANTLNAFTKWPIDIQRTRGRNLNIKQKKRGLAIV